jgi:hypothetical protein
MGTTVAAEKRWSGGTTRRRGSRTLARSLRATGVHGIEKTAQDGSLPSCAAPGWLTATSRRRRLGNRKRRRLGFAAALGPGVWARVGGSRGGGRLIKAWGGPLACESRTRWRVGVELAAAARPRPSPGRERRGGGD